MKMNIRNVNGKLIGLALFAFTTVTVAFYPGQDDPVISHTTQPVIPLPPPAIVTDAPPRVDVVFALDTTGSMGGLIQAAKEKIWSIATTMSQAQPAPELRIGLVAYRDRGDDYVTRVVDLSTDLDSVYATLMDFAASGGGDGPESVNQALHDAVNNVSWSQDPDAYKVVFLVGDAPPHMDYQDDVKYPDTVAAAQRNGIVINTIQCGDWDVTTQPWQRIAQLGDGRYFEVGQAGSAVALVSPFDADIARLSAELDDTRLFFGDKEAKAKMDKKTAATSKLHALASPASRARRATYNVSAAGEANLWGESELIDALEEGRADLGTIEKDALPEPMQSMDMEEQARFVEETAAKRAELKKQIAGLAGQRAGYLRQKVAETGGAEDSLDEKIYRAVREQAEEKGIELADAPSY
jgi:uncharacterized protein YegL